MDEDNGVLERQHPPIEENPSFCWENLAANVIGVAIVVGLFVWFCV